MSVSHHHIRSHRTTRLLHVSDTPREIPIWELYSREDFANTFEQAIEYAIDKDVEEVICVDDSFEARYPRLPD